LSSTAAGASGDVAPEFVIETPREHVDGQT
jgi:hypothetical protein